MGAEVTGDIWKQTGQDVESETIGQEQDPDPDRNIQVSMVRQNNTGRKLTRSENMPKRSWSR